MNVHIFVSKWQYFAIYRSAFLTCNGGVTSDMFIGTAEGSINMLHVLSALLRVFDANLLVLCLVVMVASWPTGSQALSLEKERDPICCHQGSLHLTGLERLPLPPSNPPTHPSWTNQLWARGWTARNPHYTGYKILLCSRILSWDKMEWFSCFWWSAFLLLGF